MFYCTTTGQYIQEGQAFEIDGTQYPANWLNLSTPEEKAAINLVDVVQINQPANPQYYWVQENLNGAELSYTNTPKDLVDVKTNAINQINNAAYLLLQPTDWMVVKSVETSTAIPKAWNTWRQSVRSYATSSVNAIEATSDVAEVEVIMSNLQWPNDPDHPAYTESLTPDVTPAEVVNGHV